MVQVEKPKDAVKEMAADIKKSLDPAAIQRLIELIQPSAPTALMTPEAFDDLMDKMQSSSSRRGFSEKSIKAARLVLVMGASVAEAAAETGLTRQAVDQLMKRIERRQATVPAGWVRVDEWFPANIGRDLSDLAKRLQELSDKESVEGMSIQLNGGS